MTKAARDNDTVSTRVIKSQELEVNGVKFHWWAVGQQPMLVTVRSELFGSASKFTYGDTATFAVAMAKAILEEHYQQL